MSVFHGANNTTINNGVFNAISNTVTNNVMPPNDVVAVLLHHSATAGLLDAAERFDAPKCQEGTRTSMVQGMKNFVQKGGPASVFWLHGPAGVGKSALAQTLALSLKDEGDHAASFFFSRTSSRRKDGNQLIVTLACQLVLSIPPLKPLIEQAVKDNPLIFNATNVVKMQTLIVDPLNRLHTNFYWNPLTWARILAMRKLHPRLILVDGLDECNDPLVQRDILLCIGNAVRQLSLPFRFIVVSRPESHISATFELDPVFQGPHGVKMSSKNLGDDEEAGEQIKTFLLKEFAEIRRTHPIREFLPQPWPLPGQIAQLVSKSSKGFIYPTTVIRYIKMANNRPDECLERILGLSEIPAHDKPYEPLDNLYRYIFESIPDVNKEAVRNIFHFLVVPNNLYGVITPQLIEKHHRYKPGHVQHVLGDLLSVVTLTGLHHPIKVLHASLPDFLLDPIRSGTLCIGAADAHTAITVGLYESFGQAACLNSSTFTQAIHHLMQSNVTDDLLNVLIEFNPIDEYKLICKVVSNGHSNIPKSAMQSTSEAFLESSTLVVAHLLAFVIKNVPAQHIENHVKKIETYILQNYRFGVFLHAVGDDIIHEVFPFLQKCTNTTNSCVMELCETSYGTQHPSQLIERISKLHMLMMTPCITLPKRYRPASNSPVHPDLTDLSVTYPRLAYTLLVFLKKVPSDTGMEGLFSFVVDLISAFMARSAYSKPLLNLLEQLIATQRRTSESNSGCMAKYYPQLTPAIGQYFERVRLQAPATTL